MSHWYDSSAHEAHLRAVRRRRSEAWRRDPVYGPLTQLAANAEPMTPDLWEAMKQGFRHAPVRPEERAHWSRARLHHDSMYGGAVKLS